MRTFEDEEKMPAKLKKKTAKIRKEKDKVATTGKVNDWRCTVCDNLNFGFRSKCNRCGNKHVPMEESL